MQLTKVEDCLSVEDFIFSPTEIFYCAAAVNLCSFVCILDVDAGTACSGPNDTTEEHVNII